MALNAHLKIIATRHGEVQGSVTQKGREGTIMVIAVQHAIVGPRDPVTGRPTGKRIHKPFVITKEVDRSSPILYSILANNENIASWELQFYTPDKTGIERRHYTVRLTNANIASIQLRMMNVRKPSLMRIPEREDVAFTYEKVSWTWTEGGIAAEDDWATPR
jgi:type VI secretion system secreted protein Hcp